MYNVNSQTETSTCRRGVVNTAQPACLHMQMCSLKRERPCYQLPQPSVAAGRRHLVSTLNLFRRINIARG